MLIETKDFGHSLFLLLSQLLALTIERSLIIKGRQTRGEITFGTTMPDVLGITGGFGVDSNVALVMPTTKRTGSYFFTRAFDTRSKGRTFESFTG